MFASGEETASSLLVFVMRAVPLDAMAEKLWLTMIRDGLLAERRILASNAWIGRREP